MDLFSKWVETYAMPLLHSWRATELFYNYIVNHWAKLHYVQMDNGAENFFFSFC